VKNGVENKKLVICNATQFSVSAIGQDEEVRLGCARWAMESFQQDVGQTEVAGKSTEPQMSVKSSKLENKGLVVDKSV
jgi:hypothetical protein